MSTSKPVVHLPYIDEILSKVSGKDENYERAFMQNIHFGFWRNQDKLDDNPLKSYEQGTANLTEQILNLSQVADKSSVLDIGCGFGGTINVLNQKISESKIVGLNIDERQIEVARKKYGKAQNKNEVSFVVADAQKMPFENNSFDIALAIECIMHMPDRNKFLSEAFRVLKPGGVLVVTEIVLDNKRPIKLAYNMLKNLSLLWTYKKNIGTIGSPGTSSSYKSLAKKNNFTIEKSENWSENILPTFSLLKILKSDASTNSLYSHKLLEFGEVMIRNGSQNYMVFVLRKQV